MSNTETAKYVFIHMPTLISLNPYWLWYSTWYMCNVGTCTMQAHVYEEVIYGTYTYTLSLCISPSPQSALLVLKGTQHGLNNMQYLRCQNVLPSLASSGPLLPNSSIWVTLDLNSKMETDLPLLKATTQVALCCCWVRPKVETSSMRNCKMQGSFLESCRQQNPFLQN